MPRRLAFVAAYQGAILSYDDAPLQARQVHVQTEIASGKHGTTFGMVAGRTFVG